MGLALIISCLLYSVVITIVLIANFDSNKKKESRNAPNEYIDAFRVIISGPIIAQQSRIRAAVALSNFLEAMASNDSHIECYKKYKKVFEGLFYWEPVEIDEFGGHFVETKSIKFNEDGFIECYVCSDLSHAVRHAYILQAKQDGIYNEKWDSLSHIHELWQIDEDLFKVRKKTLHICVMTGL